MIRIITTGIYISFFLFFCMKNDIKCQEVIDVQIKSCSKGCVNIGKSELKKHSYNWILNGSGLDYQTSSIEICDAKNGDFYTLRELNKKGKLTETIRYEIIILDNKIRISSIDPCVLKGEPATISIIGDFKEYKWSTGETSNSITIASDESVTIEVIDNNNCRISREINVKKEASNDIRNRLLKEGFHEIPIDIKQVKKKKN